METAQVVSEVISGEQELQNSITANGPSAFQTIIEPPKRWQFVNLSELWQYRELIFTLAWRDVRVRYKQTILGIAWAVIQPALTMVVFTVFFGRLAGLTTGGIPQPIFYLTGILPWFYFSSAVGAISNSVLGSERLITKIYFPRLAIPFSSLGSTTIDFAVSCGLLLVMIVSYLIAGFVFDFSWKIIFAPIIVAIIGILALGLGTGLAALNVMYRDFRYVIPFFLQLGMFATPTIYTKISTEPGPLMQLVLAVNPMTGLVAGFRASIIGGPLPWADLAISSLVAIFALVAGCLYFRKVEDRFADII